MSEGIKLGEFLSDFRLTITLRDYFAAAALQGLLAGLAMQLAVPGTPECERDRDALVNEAIQFADAMLAAREAQ